MLLSLPYFILLPFLILAYSNYVELKTFVETRHQFTMDTEFKPDRSRLYDPMRGSPVCYTGACQMDNFKHSVFELKYTSGSSGSCINASVSDGVQLLCLPGATLNVPTEEIRTISKLQQSTFERIDVSVSVYGWGKLTGLFASYGYSQQTTYLQKNTNRYFIEQLILHLRKYLCLNQRWNHQKAFVL